MLPHCPQYPDHLFGFGCLLFPERQTSGRSPFLLLWEVPMVFPVDLELFYLLAKLHVALKAAHIILQMDSSPLFMAVIYGCH